MFNFGDADPEFGKMQGKELQIALGRPSTEPQPEPRARARTRTRLRARTRTRTRT